MKGRINKMYGTYTQKPRLGRTITAIVATLGAYTLIHVSTSGSKKPEEPYADRTPEIRNVESLRHNALDGLYLTIEEGRKVKDNGRQITFFDFGFDGKLDEIVIRQHERKEYITTNQAELDKWQPHFEQMRNRRFGIMKE